MWKTKQTEDKNSGVLNAMMGLNSIGEVEQSPRRTKKDLPPLFWYMETQDWEKAAERLRRHPREVKTWATLRTKSMDDSTNTTKRLALHHACFKLRGAGAIAAPTATADPFLEVCKFILLLIQMHPDAAQKRESRHGCLPLHLASFASCAPRENPEEELKETIAPLLMKPVAVTKRSNSDATTDTTQTNLSAIHAEETYTGAMTDKVRADQARKTAHAQHNPNVSVSMKESSGYSVQREELLVQVVNALLDAYPKAVRVDSEGGRLPLHTACAGRATPRVIATLITAYPAAARQRNKDGFLPLHLSAHWGVSHIAVATQLLRCYPDATVGRNRWERTPLEEALCMAGENGRPHQAALVRALRKHPSWWTRPQADHHLTNSSGSGNRRKSPVVRHNVVDVDESLAGDESTIDRGEGMTIHEADALRYEVGEEVVLPPSPPPTPPGLMSRLSPRSLLGPAKKATINNIALADPLGVGVSLAHLIERRQWKIVLARIRQDSMEAEQDLQVMTRGGFMASIGMSPLHYACERKPPADVVKKLVEAFPMAVLTRAMPGGCLPLHIACTWGGEYGAIKALVEADVGSARVKDELGNIALHSACFSGADLLAVEALVAADEKSILARNHQGSRPLDICKRLRHDNRKTVMALLTNKKEEIMRAHRRSRSSGLLSEIAREAEEINRRDGAPGAAVGVEVTYDGKQKQAGGQEPLLWI